jgi:hypothetical protein
MDSWHEQFLALNVGLKTERKRTEICLIVFVSPYLNGIENEIGNPGNEYGNENHRK